MYKLQDIDFYIGEDKFRIPGKHVKKTKGNSRRQYADSDNSDIVRSGSEDSEEVARERRRSLHNLKQRRTLPDIRKNTTRDKTMLVNQPMLDRTIESDSDADDTKHRRHISPHRRKTKRRSRLDSFKEQNEDEYDAGSDSADNNIPSVRINLPSNNSFYSNDPDGDGDRSVSHRQSRASILQRAEQLIKDREARGGNGTFTVDKRSPEKRRLHHSESPLRSTKANTTHLRRHSKYSHHEYATTSESDEEQFFQVKTVVSDYETDDPLPLRNGGYGSRNTHLSVRSFKSDSFHTFAEDPQDGEETDRLVGYPESLAAHSNTSSRATLKGRPDSFRYEPQPGLQDGGLYPLSEPDPATRRKLSKRGTLVTFYSYGNPDFKGIVVCISQKTFSDFEKLLVYANEKVPTSTGAKHIFRYPDWKEIKSVTQFEPGGHYVVASVKTVDRSTRYGISREKFWHTTNPSAGKIGKMRPSELHLYKGRDSDTSSDSPIRKTARVLKVISNLSRKSSEKLILNPHIRQSFEEWLSDMSNSLIIPRPPIKAMYSAEPPHLRVESFSQLSRDFKDHDTFIICGAEMTPIDMKKKRPAPSSNSSNDSTGREKNIKKRPLGYGSGDGADVLPNGSYSSISETPRLNVARRPNDKNLSPTRMGPPSQMMNQSRQSRDDGSIRTEIDGRLKEFFRPTYHEVEDDGTKPEKTLKLEWVYGFNGRDIRCNIVVLGKTGELVYYIAGVAVLFDKWKDLQRHYLGHNEDITCLDLHPDGIHVATGQMAGSSVQNGAHIRIWHGLSLSTIAVVGLGHLHRGVVAISFSQQSDGYYMMSVDASERHILSVWDWQKETLIARTTTSNDKVTGGTFYPLDDTILITYGKVHLHFWKLFWDPMKEQEGKILRDKKSGVFQESDTPKQITAIAFNDIGDVITGDSSGSVRVWVRDDTSAFTQEYQLASNMRHAHRKPVLCLCVLKDGTLLSGGDNEIRAWDSGNNYMEVKERIMPENAGNVAAMIPQAFGGADGALYIGTTRGCILDGSLQHKFKFVVQGHSDSVWAVTSHPEEPAFITAGHDQLVIKWSAVSHKIVWRVQVEKPCLSASIHPKGRVVALGTSAGRIIILNSANGTHHTSVQVTESQVKSTLFSPGGHMLALGCHDGSMHLFSVEEDAQLFRRIHTVPKMHASPVVHIDWSNDNRFIRVVSGDFDLAYFDIEKKQTVKNSRTMRGVKWFTHNANVSYHTLGPWSLLESADQHINVAARSQYRDLLLTGDDKGRLRLYKYPCATQKPAFRGCKAYSGDITGACFLAEDLNVVSVGENEAALLQWAVEDCRRS